MQEKPTLHRIATLMIDVQAGTSRDENLPVLAMQIELPFEPVSPASKLVDLVEHRDLFGLLTYRHAIRP